MEQADGSLTLVLRRTFIEGIVKTKRIQVTTAGDQVQIRIGHNRYTIKTIQKAGSGKVMAIKGK